MFVFDAQIYTGCRVCEQICFQTHYQGSLQDHSKIKILSQWPEVEKVTVCSQCSNPKCVEACPTGALQKQNGFIQCEVSQCTQCLLCFDACPHGAKVIDQLGFPSFCDTCRGQFQCIQLCPPKAFPKPIYWWERNGSQNTH